jgi:transcriptional regulator with XRE-family HTH domain
MSNGGMGRRIRYRREQLGLGLRELARRVGMQPGHLSQVERGIRTEITTGTLRRLAYHLGVTADWIVGPYEEDQDEEDRCVAATSTPLGDSRATTR